MNSSWVLAIIVFRQREEEEEEEEEEDSGWVSHLSTHTNIY